MFYTSHNGGEEIEKFNIEDNIIEHGRSLSSLISAKQGLRATEVMVMIGDEEKQVCIWHDYTRMARFPIIYYQLVGNN